LIAATDAAADADLPDAIRSDPSNGVGRSPPLAAWWTVYGLLILLLLSLGLAAALEFNGEPIDGPFQLYNALRRIMAGQRGGVDFQFFHGLGIPYLHYPLFRLFGASFTASEVSRQIITTLSGPLVVLGFFRMYLGDWRRALGWSSVVVALSVVLQLWPIVLTVNSLLALRSAAAMIPPILWIARIDSRIRGVLTGVTLGAALLLGTEQGLAIIAAYGVVSLLVMARFPSRAAIIELALAIAATAGSVALFFIAVGGVSGLRGAVNYNLRLVPMDQYWYFGAPPNPFIGRWGRLIPSLAAQPAIAFTLVAGLLTTLFMLRSASRRPDARRASGLAMLLLYGLVSCTSLLGILLISYVEPLIRILLMVSAVWADGALRRSTRVVAGRRLSLGLVTAASCVLLVVTSPRLVWTAIRSASIVVSRHVATRTGMVFSDDWRQTIRVGQRMYDANRSTGHGPVLWSTYAGLLEARNGVFHPSTDYIIHVLGPDARSQYVRDFHSQQPGLVQTVLPTRTPYETWIEQTSWDFYDDVIRHYRVAGNSDWSIFWQRLPDSLPAPEIFWSGTIASDDRLAFDVPEAADSSPRLIAVTVHYRATNRMHALPIVGAMPRYLVLTGGAITRPPVTLDPYTTTARFPLAVRPGAHIQLDFETYSLLPAAHLEITGVSAAAYVRAASYRPWLINFSCAGQPETVLECQ
jgi:hypothetical protein